MMESFSISLSYFTSVESAQGFHLFACSIPAIHQSHILALMYPFDYQGPKSCQHRITESDICNGPTGMSSLFIYVLSHMPRQVDPGSNGGDRSFEKRVSNHDD